jgi:hypothetical protein
MSELFERWTSVRELWSAARRAARGKRHRASVGRALLELEPTVLSLSTALRSASWRPGRATTHAIRDPKPRVIAAAPFVDRVVHQSLCHAVGPLLDRGLVHDTYACRVGRGTHAAVERAVAWARTYRFALHLDVQKFFPSVDHAILLAQLERDIGCPRTLEVCQRILTAGLDVVVPRRWHFPGDDLFTPWQRSVGLPIGNLTSQHFANRFLSPVDHRVKDRLRVRAYLRYMDDFLVFHDDREALREVGVAIEAACMKLRLRLHPWQVVPTRAGVGFLGYRILPDVVRVKRSSVARAQARLADRLAVARGNPDAMKAFLASLRSTFAHWKHADSWRLREKTLHDLGILANDEDAP